MEKKSKVWGAAAEVASAPAALAAGLVGGTANVVSGHGGFMEGMENTVNDVSDSARKFGEDHGAAITDGLLRGAASSLGSHAANRGHKSSN